MKPRILLSIILLLIGHSVVAQHKIVIKKYKCGFSKTDTTTDIYATNADDEVLEYVKKICNAAGINQNFVIQSSISISVACSSTDSTGHRFIFYNPGFFGSLQNETYKIAILAHEIAHHLNNNFGNDRTQTDEKEADEFAGNIICKLGLKLEDALELVNFICDRYGNGYYPPRSERLKAFTDGFKNAGCKNNSDQYPNNTLSDHNNESPILKPDLTTNTFVLLYTDGHFVGNGFTVTLPSNFIARPSIRSVTTNAAQSFFFTSPDGEAEFYIFLSPWGNIASDIAVDSKTEILTATNVGRGGEIVRYDIRAKDNSYERAYLEIQSQKENIHIVKGIKYKTQAAYNTYYPYFKSFFQTTSK